jgi:hypothetical protein
MNTRLMVFPDRTAIVSGQNTGKRPPRATECPLTCCAAVLKCRHLLQRQREEMKPKH